MMPRPLKQPAPSPSCSKRFPPSWPRLLQSRWPFPPSGSALVRTVMARSLCSMISSGLFDDFVPKFVKPYAHLKADALQALRRYKEEVEQGKFP